MFRQKQSMCRLNSHRFVYTKKCSCSDRDSKSQDDNAKKNKKQKSNNSKRCKVVSKLLIPEELMFEILSLLPVHCLLNSARYVCKPWATTIRSPLFAEACLHHARSKPGLYVEHIDSRSSYFLDIIDDVNGQLKLERTDLGTPPRMGTIVSSCDGILLLYCYGNGNRQHFMVNPILKCWLRIPPLSISKHCGITLARVPHTTMFKLFFTDVLEVSGAVWYVFYVLRIGIDNSLKEIARKEASRMSYFLQAPLYSGGNDVYYITTKGITAVDVDKEIIVGEYPFPPVKMYPEPIWLSMGDHLSCIVRKGFLDHETYEIYILDFDSGKWSLYHKMGPFNFAAFHDRESHIQTVLVRLWINDQAIIEVYIGKKEESRRSWKGNSSTSITYFNGMEKRHKKEDLYTGARSIHFSYNVKTKRLEQIVGSTKEGDVRVWLHTNSLISLPSTST